MSLAMRPTARSGLTAAGLAAFVLGAALFGPLLSPADAGHYQISGYCGSPHGLVHGSSTTDGAFHSRVEIGGCPPTYKVCSVGVIYSDFYVTDRSYQTTCNASYNHGGNEQEGIANTFYEAVFDPHGHRPHSHY